MASRCRPSRPRAACTATTCSSCVSPTARHVAARCTRGCAKRGIGTQLHYIPIYRHSLYRSLGYGDDPGRFPNTERYYEQALSLPMFPGMTPADVSRVADALAAELA